MANRKITFKRYSSTGIDVKIDGADTKWTIEKRYFWSSPYYSVRLDGVEVEMGIKLSEAKKNAIKLISDSFATHCED